MAFAWLGKDFRTTDDYIGAAKELTDYDFPAARRYYECVKSGDYGPEIEGLEARLKQWPSVVPSGYLRVKVAVLKALGAGNLADAQAALEGVRLEANDFPWLADVLTIHRAWAYARAGDAAGETEEVDRFLAKQPMLFEPDHAVSFGVPAVPGDAEAQIPGRCA